MSKGLTQKALSESSGVPAARINEYWKGPKEANPRYLFAIASALGVSAEWLVLGRGPKSNRLIDANDADFVDVPEYDLRNMQDDGKGEPIGSTTFRRDWLYVTLNDSSDLWVARMLAPNLQLQLPAGTPLFCKDQKPGDPMIEGVHYFFRVNGGIVLAKFTFRGAGLYTGETVATPIDMERDEDQHFVIAKVLGTVARPL